MGNTIKAPAAGIRDSAINLPQFNHDPTTVKPPKAGLQRCATSPLMSHRLRLVQVGDSIPSSATLRCNATPGSHLFQFAIKNARGCGIPPRFASLSLGFCWAIASLELILRWYGGFFSLKDRSFKRRVRCKYCGKEVNGFNHLKHHLATVGSDVTACIEVPPVVKTRMRDALLGEEEREAAEGG
ncbi:hypothetical protein BHM03_00059018 [Ensete ventricosum]|nr:hypothetical protein BHM03_00059018 [Ensete ventricosum]